MTDRSDGCTDDASNMAQRRAPATPAAENVG